MSDDMNADVNDPDTEDAALLARIEAAHGPDPAPAGLEARIAGLFALRDLDRELVELMADGLVEPVGSRGSAATADVLTFELGGGLLTLEVTLGPAGLHGQVLAGDLTEVSVEFPTGERDTSAVDELGRFGFDPVAHGLVARGPIRLVLMGRSDRPSTTDWFLP